MNVRIWCCAEGRVSRPGVGTLVAVELEGWNSIPVGWGASFDLHSARWWLRVWFHTPFVDRYAYPVVVRRGYGWLSPQPGLTDDELGRVPPGWRIRPDGYESPGSTAYLS